MMKREDIINIGRDKAFVPAEYVNMAKGDAAVCVLEQSKPKALADLITYFEGFARGMEEMQARKV